MTYINSFNELNENKFNNFVLGIIVSALLNSCSVSNKHKDKEINKTSIYSDPNWIKKKYPEISSGNYSVDKPSVSTKFTTTHNPTNFSHLPWPVPKGTIKHKYGIETHNKISINNNGICIGDCNDLCIKPVYKGVISKIFDVCGDTTVIVNHGHYYTVYAGFNKLNKIKVGRKVNTTTILGTAKSEIEFQIWQNKNDKTFSVNPALFLVK